MMTDAVNENTKEEDTGESECDSEHENAQPVINIRLHIFMFTSQILWL